MNPFEYATPQTLEESFELFQKKSSVFKAGGIDLLDLMKEGMVHPQRLVNIRFLEELRQQQVDAQGNLHLGASLTLEELEKHPLLQEGAYRALSQAGGGAATPQIRNMATLGGNLCQRPRCWYFRNQDFNCLRKGGSRCFALEGENQYHAVLDTQQGCVMVHPSALAVALIALRAHIKVFSSEESREFPLEEFFVRPAQHIQKETVLAEDELIQEVILPAPRPGERSFYYKQKAKQSFDWPLAEVAVSLRLEEGTCQEARIVLGAAAPTPWRALEAEAVLKQQKITKALAQQCAEQAMEKAMPLSQNRYKVALFKAVIRRSVCWAAGLDPLV
jgi:xanthine dehydrogenase YagS FAD-binding subunit